MNRRQMLKRLALMAGGTLSTPAIAAVLSDFRPVEAQGYVPKTLSPAQNELVATVAELIIPTTDTPGARAAGVDRYIDGLLTSIFAEQERDHFLAGLSDLDARARGTGFVASSADTQVQILRELEAESFLTNTRSAGVGFFQTLKELTLVGYYRSEIGATQELQYLPIPGQYIADLPLTKDSRAWSKP